MKDQKEIVVTVAGYPGSGKSTIIKMITIALQDVGIKYEIEDEGGVLDGTMTRVLALARHGTHVKIKSRQRRRVIK